MQVRISVSIYNQQTSGSLNVEEVFVINDIEFLEMSKILGQFHELAQRVKSERSK